MVLGLGLCFGMEGCECIGVKIVSGIQTLDFRIYGLGFQASGSVMSGFISKVSLRSPRLWT